MFIRFLYFPDGFFFSKARNSYQSSDFNLRSYQSSLEYFIFRWSENEYFAVVSCRSSDYLRKTQSLLSGEGKLQLTIPAWGSWYNIGIFFCGENCDRWGCLINIICFKNMKVKERTYTTIMIILDWSPWVMWRNWKCRRVLEPIVIIAIDPGGTSDFANGYDAHIELIRKISWERSRKFKINSPFLFASLIVICQWSTEQLSFWSRQTQMIIKQKLKTFL